jgi:hypothetical protein
MTHNSHETKAIRQRMEGVRCDLDKDVQGIVEGVREMRDWRSYVRTYPWACVGATLAVGYWIAPRRHVAMRPTAESIAKLVEQGRMAETPLVTPLRKARGLLLRCVGNLVMQGVSAYVGQQAGKHFGPQAVSAPQDGQR